MLTAPVSCSQPNCLFHRKCLVYSSSQTNLALLELRTSCMNVQFVNSVAWWYKESEKIRKKRESENTLSSSPGPNFLSLWFCYLKCLSVFSTCGNLTTPSRLSNKLLLTELMMVRCVSPKFLENIEGF